ncbi:predicted protein [Postia placenta Mad-698-R]|nr:predicted protein [Postia placenta Mad-698-R]
MCTPFLESKGLFSGVCTLFSFLRERFDSLDGYLVLNALLYYIPVKHYSNDKALPVDGNLFHILAITDLGSLRLELVQNAALQARTEFPAATLIAWLSTPDLEAAGSGRCAEIGAFSAEGTRYTFQSLLFPHILPITMTLEFETRTKFKIGDEVRFRPRYDNDEVVGKVVAIHMTTDSHVSYALAIDGSSITRMGLTKVPEEKIRGLSNNMPFFVRLRHHLHIR